jgi:hypothetical protein
LVFYLDAGLQRDVRARTDFALVDMTPGQSRRRRPLDLEMRLSELTAFFSVFSFHAPLKSIRRAASIDAALAAGTKDFCLIQNVGHVFYGYDPLSYAMTAALDACDFVTGFVDEDRLAPRCLLVNRRTWESRGRPSLDGLPAAPVASAVRPFDDAVATASHACAPVDGDIFEWLGVLDDVTRGQSADPELQAALAFLRNTPDRADAPRKVFVFNSESDDDLPQLRVRPGLDCAFVLASGFKANRILETLGFHAGTHVITYDYSAPALALRKMMVERWDGQDLARFFQEARPAVDARFPGTAYLPPALITDPASIAREFQREIASVFTGADHWLDHWRRFRAARHSFVEVDVIGDRDSAKALIEANAQGHAVIWISDMFNSPNAVGKFSWNRRRAAFEVIAGALKARTTADLILGGAPALWLPA